MPDHVRRELEKAGKVFELSTDDDVNLSVGDIFFFTAFLDLDSERVISESGLSPIPFLKIIKYSEFVGLDFESAQDLAYVIRKVDNAHIDSDNKRRSKLREDLKRESKKPVKTHGRRT